MNKAVIPPPEKKRNVNMPIFSEIAAVPHMVWMVLFVALPLIFVAYYAFTDLDGRFTFSNILALSEHAGTFLTSVCYAFLATTICLLIGYPLAFAISRAPAKRQGLLIILLMIPMWMNLLIRTYSLMALLDDGGLLNGILNATGLPEIHIIGTAGAVIFGMVYDFFPYMVLPIYSVMTKQNERLIEAAYDLGCSRLSAHFKVTMPLSVPGIISGITMVFVPSISTFYISQKLGGGTKELIGDTIERQINNPATRNVGAAISLVMMILILISVTVMNKFTDDDEAGGVLL